MASFRPAWLGETAGVFLLATCAYGALALPYSAPPYMDAYYYVDVGRSLAAGHGFTENFIWNYLPPPRAIVHPSSTYWLPLFSVLVAGSISLFGPGYAAERLPAILCAAAYVALTYALARWLFAGAGEAGARRDGTGRRPALLAAGLVLFNGIWAHDFVSPDAFGAYALLATASLAAWGIAVCGGWSRSLPIVVAGVTAGLAMLTRQEGVFLIPSALLALAGRLRRQDAWRGVARVTVLYALGVGLSLSPWLWHQWRVGNPSGGGVPTVWLRSYGDFFSYGADLSPASYLAWGWHNIVASKVIAAQFLVALWIFLWQIVLVPVLVWGLVRWRGHCMYRPFFIYAGFLAAVPFVFTFPSLQGTLAHASMSLLGFAACAIAAGFEHLTRQRAAAARWALAALIVAGVAAVTLWSARRSFDSTAGERRQVRTAVVWLDRHVPGTTPVMVDDPPAFAYFSSRPTVIMPSNGLQAVLRVARRYGVRYWVAGRGEGPPTPHAGNAVGIHRVGVLPDGVTIYRFDTR